MSFSRSADTESGRKSKSALDILPAMAYNDSVKAISMWPFGGGIPPLRREGKSMWEVHVKDGESLENALKRFKRSCAKSGVLAEVRKREHYESPSVKRRKKSEAARKNRKKYY